MGRGCGRARERETRRQGDKETRRQTFLSPALSLSRSHSPLPIFLFLGDVGEDEERDHGEQKQRQSPPWRPVSGFGPIAFDEWFRPMAINEGPRPIDFDERSSLGRSHEAGYPSAEDLGSSAFL